MRSLSAVSPAHFACMSLSDWVRVFNRFPASPNSIAISPLRATRTCSSLAFSASLVDSCRIFAWAPCNCALDCASSDSTTGTRAARSANCARSSRAESRSLRQMPVTRFNSFNSTVSFWASVSCPRTLSRAVASSDADSARSFSVMTST